MKTPITTRGVIPKWTFSWYYHNEPGHPKEILIGPQGHGTKHWEELGPVLTPPERHSNPFYMEGECACVIREHGLQSEFKASATGGFYGNIAYTVPDVATSQPMTIAYVDEAARMLDALRKKHLCLSK